MSGISKRIYELNTCDLAAAGERNQQRIFYYMRIKNGSLVLARWLSDP